MKPPISILKFVRNPNHSISQDSRRQVETENGTDFASSLRDYFVFVLAVVGAQQAVPGAHAWHRFKDSFRAVIPNPAASCAVGVLRDLLLLCVVYARRQPLARTEFVRRIQVNVK